MSRRTRNPFTKISRFFKQHFDSSRSTSSPSSVDASSAKPPPILPPRISTPLSSLNIELPSTQHDQQPPQPPNLSPSHSSNSLATSLRAPSPAFPHPQPLTPSISRVPTPAYASSSLQPLPRSIEHGIPPSGPTASSQNNDAVDLLLLPPTSDPTRPLLLPPASHAPTPQLGGPTYFSGAHGFNISSAQFIDFSLAGSGIDKLLKNSMPDTFHNSAARYPPPKCHFGTREEYITKITDWALGNSNHHEPILWMCGPFGIGKSAVAQSCAEVLQLQNRLAATLFFSRSNADRDDTRRVFTSIAYQIATLCEPFSNIVDARIRKDPAISMKSLSTQFEELLVRPLGQVDIARSGMDGCVVIIDGLDECRGSSEQCEIIRIIATSARDRTTPFRWFITSRPEDPIIRTMKSPAVLSISLHLELPVSRKIDHEILLYLVDEFKKIRESYGLAESWPSEEVLALLVDRTAGLWIYVTTIVRFITDKNSFGPEDQLRIVAEFAKSISAKVGTDNPLAEMDLFYMLIVRQVPRKVSTVVRKILLLYSTWDNDPECIAALLDLSEEQFRRSCVSIQSVVELRGSDFKSTRFHFYHASFLDFMKDPVRSKELSIYGEFLIEFRRDRLDWLHQVCLRSTGPEDITFPSEPILVSGWNPTLYYCLNLIYILFLCGAPRHPLDPQTAASLARLPFQLMLRLVGDNIRYIHSQEVKNIRDNLPIELRDKIIREGKCPTPGCTNTENVLILGHGENETVAEGSVGSLKLTNNQGPRPGQCFCGSPLEREHSTSSSHSDSSSSLES